MIEWIFAKMAAAWVKALVVVAAILMPVCLTGWVWEGVSLHGVAIPAPKGFPLYGPWEIVHGALDDTKAAQAARALAEKDRDGWKKAAAQYQSGLNICSAHVAGLGEAAKTWQAAAQKMVDEAIARFKTDYLKRAAAINKIKTTDEKCPMVDQIFSVGVAP